MLCLSRDLRGFCAFLSCSRRGFAVCVSLVSAATAWPLAAAAAASGGPGAGRAPLSRRREIWLVGSCPPPEATVSPLGAGRLLFQACRRARSTGVRPPPLPSFGDIALGVIQS